MGERNIKVSIVIEEADKVISKYLLIETAKPIKGKNGKTTLAHYQPAPDNTVVKPFSKNYIDISALKK
uniref:Uncharacterized protein n=1 Tax=viral metagenome TaxID=1070528 RepID=A0A6M3LN47_9ZZZZ